jgi:hypothetical protein
MDIIKNIINLNNDDLNIFFNNLIKNSDNDLEKILTTNIDDKLSIKILIENTYIFDTYSGYINLMNLITKDNTHWKKIESLIHDYNVKFNCNKKLLNLIIKLIEKTNDKYEKIFLVKMSKSMEKYGILNKNIDKISKILLQLEQTENNIYNLTEKSINIKIDRNKIDARSDSIMSSVYSNNNIIKINNKTFYYLIKKLKDINIRKDLEEKYNRKYIEMLPLIGKLFVLRNIYSKSLGYNNYYDFCSNKTNEETIELQNLITDLNNKLDSSFGKIVKELKDIIKKDKITFNDIIYTIETLRLDIKLKPIEILQYVMIVIQKKFNIEFKSSKTYSLNKFSNCIEVYCNKKILKGYLFIDLIKRDEKNINKTTVIKINSQYKNNLPSVYLMSSYSELEKEMCTYSELVNMFREFGNVLINIFAYTPNGLNEIDIETYNFIPDIMEFLAYDDCVLELICKKSNSNNFNKIKKNMKLLRRLELIVNLKLKCANSLFDNVVHSSQTLFDSIKKSNLEEIKNILIDLNYKIMNDIFGKHNNNIEIDKNYIFPSFINNLINGNQGFIYGTILSIILAFNAYTMIDSNDFIINLLENKEYSYRKMILEFISKLNHDYYDEFLTKCLNIELKKVNAYDDFTQTERNFD